jgi:hypothetical protein
MLLPKQPSNIKNAFLRIGANMNSGGATTDSLGFHSCCRNIHLFLSQNQLATRAHKGRGQGWVALGVHI